MVHATFFPCHVVVEDSHATSKRQFPTCHGGFVHGTSSRYSFSPRTAFMLKIFHVMFSLLHVMVVFVYMRIHFSM